MTAHHPDAAAIPLAHSVAPIGHDYLNTKGLVYMEDVHNFALQIACGLEHLASMQVNRQLPPAASLWCFVFHAAIAESISSTFFHLHLPLSFRSYTVTWQLAMCSLQRALFSRLPILVWQGISVKGKCTRRTQE